MIYKCAREQRRLRRHRLPKRLLKKIPVIKYNKNQPYESCSICLDDYVEGEKLRVLPCAHGKISPRFSCFEYIFVNCFSSISLPMHRSLAD